MKLRTKYFIIPALGRLSWDDKAQIKAQIKARRMQGVDQSG